MLRDRLHGPHEASTGPRPAKPVLASELLADEVAPLEPGRKTCRIWLVLIAIGFAVLGLAMRMGLGIPEQRLEAATTCFATSAAVTALALLPFPYRARACMAVVTGGLLMGLGLRSIGPLGGLAFDGGEWRDLARLVTLSVLPTTLTLRARYPAYRPARWILAAGVVCSLPFVVLESILALNAGVDPLIRTLSALSAVVLVATLLGLSQDGFTRSGWLWAWIILLLLPAEVAMREITPLGGGDTGFMTYPITGLAMLLAGLLVSLGGYQVAAHAVAPRARESLKTARSGSGSPRLNVVKS